MPAAVPFAFDHVGIVTADIDAGARSFASSVGAAGFTARFDDETLGVSVRFMIDHAGMVYEFISPLGEKSPVARTLKSNHSLLNQLAYRTPNLANGVEAMREAGSLPLGPSNPAKAFGGAHVQFLWNPLGFVVELIEQEHRTHHFDLTFDQAV